MHHPTHGRCRHVHHRIVCEHQIEIEVFPGSAEVYFADERYADPVVSQARFDAVVYNAPTGNVLWTVQAVSGGPGVGWIDQTGLYTAPLKGGTTSGLTDIVVAAAADNPERTARAFVTLVGKGPEPAPQKGIMISPRRCTLYNPGGSENGYIDKSNTYQVFTAILANTGESIKWTVNGGAGQTLGARQPFLYQVTGSEGVKTLRIRAQLSTDSTVYDEAIVSIANYTWPDEPA